MIEDTLKEADRLGWDMTALCESVVGVWYCCLTHRKMKRSEMDLTVTVEVHSQHTPDGAVEKALKIAKELHHKPKPEAPFALNEYDAFMLGIALEANIYTRDGYPEDVEDYV